jgi:hypothetical protein
MEEKKYTIDEAHKFFAIELNQFTWSLLSNPERTSEENEMMIHSAHASHYHWLRAGVKVNEQRGEWMISRVYSTLNIPGRAIFHAERCKKITEECPNDMSDFDLAYADEAMARAYACNGNHEESNKYYNLAKDKGGRITDKESKEIFTGDLNSEPWYGAIKGS